MGNITTCVDTQEEDDRSKKSQKRKTNQATDFVYTLDTDDDMDKKGECF